MLRPYLARTQPHISPTNSDSFLAFDEFLKLPLTLLPAAKEVMNFSGSYVMVNGYTTVGFDWSAFKEAVVAHSDTTLAFDKLQSTMITNQTASVNDMVGKIIQFLYVSFGIKTNVEGMRAQVSSAFLDLYERKVVGWFSSFRREGHGSSCEYRVMFALPSEDNEDWFYALVTTIRFNADVIQARSWFGMASENNHNFTANVTAMQLVVHKDFKHAA